MIYDFDYFSRYEQPELILCEADDREIGVIQGVSDLKLVINLNEVSTLSYKIYNNDEELTKEGKATDGEEPTIVKNWVPDPAKPNVYRLHKERREVHAVGVGYFIITDISEVEDSTGTYKNVSCKSCEYELNNIACPGVALNDVNMYPLFNTESYDMLSNYERFAYLEDITTEEVSDDDTGIYESKSCILFNLLCYSPTWRLSDECISRFIGDDPEHDYRELAATMRNLEDEDTTIYSYLKKNVSEAWEVFISFNIEDRTIDIYKYEDVLIPSDMVLSEANILDKCEIKTDIDDYVNALSVTGGTDDLFISDFTKSGENTIYNFDHDIAIGMIYGELKDALEYWNSLDTDEIEIEVPPDTVIPKRVYADYFNGYYGNDLYRFLNTSRNAINEWSRNYELSKGKGSGEKEYLIPPSIGVNVGGEWVEDGESTEGFNEDTRGEYCLKIVKPLLNDDVIEVIYDGGNKSVAVTPTGEDVASQVSQIIDALNENTDFINVFSAEATDGDPSSILISQNIADSDVPAIRLFNNSKVVSGEFTITIKTMGHSAGVVQFNTYEYITTDAGWEFGIKAASLDWKEDFLHGNNNDKMTVSDARKTLKYFQDEYELANGCYVWAQSYRHAFETEKAALDEDYKNSGYSYPTQVRDETYTAQYQNLELYLSVIKPLEIAYAAIRNQLTTWITTIKVMIAEANYLRQFQGAFNKYYEINYPSMDPTEREKKAVLLYNRLTRVLKEQKYQDTSIVTTDEMTMMEKYEAEQDLYNKGLSMLSRLVQPNAEVSIDAEPFMFNTEYGIINDNVKMGTCIYIELPNGEVPLYHLKQINIDYQAPSCQLVFGDRIRSNDPTDIFGELQKTANTAANIVASERINWGINSSRINYLMKEKDADIAATMRAMGNSVNNVTIDEKGLSCFSVDPRTNTESYGFWGANGSLMFFDYDNETQERVPRVAIGRMYTANGVEYGFWGDKIIANTITGEKLAIGAISNGSNYIRNGSFENVDGSGSTRKLTYWTDANGDPIGAIGYQSESDGTTIPYIPSGKKCGKIIATREIHQTTDVLSADTYTLGFCYLFNEENDVASCTVKINNVTDESETATYQKDLVGIVDNNVDKWAEETIEITIPNVQGEEYNAEIIFECSNGTVYVDSVMLAKGGASRYNVHISEVYSAYTTINENGINVYGGEIQIFDNASERCLWSDDGNLNVRGVIKAESLETTSGGTMAGWKIDAHSIHKLVNGKKTTGMSGDTDCPAFWAGYTLNSTLPSIVIDERRKIGDEPNPNFMRPYGFNGAGLEEDPHGANYMLLHNGMLYCRNADITGAIHATSLTLGSQGNMVPISDYITDVMDNNLGGWKIHEHYLSPTALQGYFTYLYGEPSSGASWVIRAGTTNSSASTDIDGSPVVGGLETFFGVHADGCMYCKGAYIDGDVLVVGNLHVNDPGVSGTGVTKIGGSWTIGNNTLYTTPRTTSSTSYYPSEVITGGDSTNDRYTLNNNNTFMLDVRGNAYSLASFYTGGPGYTGIQISGYNIYLGEKNAVDGFSSCCGAVSIASSGIWDYTQSSYYGNRDTNDMLAISGFNGIMFGRKEAGGNGSLDGWSERLDILFDKYSLSTIDVERTVFGSKNGIEYKYVPNTSGDWYKYPDGTYHTTRPEWTPSGDPINMKNEWEWDRYRYDKVRVLFEGQLGSKENSWAGLFLRDSSISLDNTAFASAELYYSNTNGTSKLLQYDCYSSSGNFEGTKTLMTEVNGETFINVIKPSGVSSSLGSSVLWWNNTYSDSINSYYLNLYDDGTQGTDGTCYGEICFYTVDGIPHLDLEWYNVQTGHTMGHKSISLT